MIRGSLSVSHNYKRLTVTVVGAKNSKVVALVLQALESTPSDISRQVQPEGSASSDGILAIFRGCISFIVLLCI